MVLVGYPPTQSLISAEIQYRSASQGRVENQPSEMVVILLREPSEAQIDRFLEGQRALLFSYPEVGASRDGAPPGYLVNHHRGRLGTGQETFAQAAAAI